jgi:hypothetical protein
MGIPALREEATRARLDVQGGQHGCRRSRIDPLPENGKGIFGEIRQSVSGTSQSVPSGGSVTSAENGWLCQAIGPASMPPRFPTSEPP